MIDVAYAMGPSPGGQGSDVSVLMQLLPIIAIMVVFYWLLIRPQQKKAQQHQQFLKTLKKGDGVITQGGLYGKIISLTDHAVTLEIADKVRVRVSRGHIAGPATLTDDQTS